jgi:hypothetical protein
VWESLEFAPMKNLRRVVLLIAFLGCGIPSTFAHKEDYIDETLVYLTLGGEEFEPEYWFDYGRLRDERREFTRHNVSAEYGITDHWMLEGRATMEKVGGDGLNFDSARLETRYRFYDEGTLPVDIAVSAEGNVERDEKGIDRYGFEPRLILSRDFAKLNLTLNLSEEIPFDSRRYAFNVSSGFRYDAAKHFSFGCELKDDVNNHEAALVPQVWFLFPHELTLKAGFSYRFDHNKEQFLRVVIEKGF